MTHPPTYQPTATHYRCPACWARTTYYEPPKVPTCEWCGARLAREQPRPPRPATDGAEQGRLL